MTINFTTIADVKNHLADSLGDAGPGFNMDALIDGLRNTGDLRFDEDSQQYTLTDTTDDQAASDRYWALVEDSTR